MKRAWIGRAAVGVTLVAVLWANTGVEKIAGDHETGPAWQGFVKQQPSLRLVFENPAQRGLELAPLAAMLPAERAAFLEYCAIRFGASDPVACQAILRKREI